MNKKLYALLIFLTALSGLSQLAYFIMLSLTGAQMFFWDSFTGWFLAMNIVSLITFVLIIKYYQYKRYRLAFATGIIAVLTAFILSILVVIILETRKFVYLHVPAQLLSLGASIVYAISLILIRKEKRNWLKIAGICTLIIGLYDFSTTLWVFMSHPLTATVEKILVWSSLAAVIIPVMFMIHFAGEHKAASNETSLSKRWEYAPEITGIMSLLIMVVFGKWIISECYSSAYWAKQNFKRTQALWKLFEPGLLVTSSGDSLPYRLLKPLNYDPTKKYPLVVSLPYGGQPPTDPIRQIEGACAAEWLAVDSNRKKYPAFLLIPHCPPGGGWGGIPNLPEADTLVYEAIIALDKQYAIDENRHYVTGVSRGGYGSWHFISKRPELFAAAIPVCGSGDPALAPKAASVAVWAFHGEKDKNVPVSGSRAMIEAIRKAGGQPKYTEYPNQDHGIWNQVCTTPGLWDWLFAQKRQ